MPEQPSFMREIVANDGTRYVWVSPRLVVEGSHANFDLYLVNDLDDPSPVLYRRRGLAFESDARQRLLESATQELLVAFEDSAAYCRYIEENLDVILSDPEVPPREKAESIYQSAQNAVREILDNPTAPDTLDRCERLARNAVTFAHSESASFKYFLEAAAFEYSVYTHSVNVFTYSLNLAQQCGMDDIDFALRFGTGALLHDIGKSKVDESILHADHELDDAQWEHMRNHPVWGWEMLAENGVTDDVILKVARSHHEKLNGRGYPDGLSGDEIPDYVRIATVCDIFDALTTQRTYKKAMSSFDALQLMKREMADEIDPDIFATFVQMMLGDKA